MKSSSANPVGAGEIWSIDVDAPLQSVLDNPKCPPLLSQTLTGVLSWQTRNETLVQRALTSPRVAPQWVAALLALGATVTVEGKTGPTEVPLETVLQRKTEGKVSVLHIPPLFSPPKGADRRRSGDEGGGMRWGEAHVARTPADEPIVAAVAVVEVDGTSGGDSVVRQARVALTGVWPEPVRLAEAPTQLAGGPLDENGIRAVAEAVEEEVEPKGDFRGSEEYRRAMAGVLTCRALEACRRQEAGDE